MGSLSLALVLGVTVYASAVRLGDAGMEYFANYDRRDAGLHLLESKPIVYTRPDGGQPAGPLAALGFMAGCWRTVPGSPAVLEEFYTTPSANVIVGVSRELRDGRTVQYEFSRITADATGVVLLPHPGGRPSAHGFRLTRSAPGLALFEAPEHDFPKRIRYSLGDDDSLTARIDGGEGDPRVQEWRMQKADCAGREQ